MVEDLMPEAYAAFARPIFAEFARPAMVTKETDVAEAVWRAANDASGQAAEPENRPTAASASST